MSWRDRALALGARFGVKPILSLPLPWAVHRQAFRLMGLRALPSEVEVAQKMVGGISCGIFTPPGSSGTLLWLHGGGFVLGSARSYATLASALALQSGRRVVVPDYRLAPEHPFPAAPDDCRDVAHALAAQGPFALGGDSAGGCLAVVTLAELLAEGMTPTHLVLVSPAADLDPDRPVPDTRDELLFPVSLLRRVGRDYAAGADPTDPRVSPVHADLDGAPPTLIHCAKGELLEEDTDALEERLRTGRAKVTVEKTAGVPHVWHLCVGRTPKADAAVARIGAFLRAAP
ncbi:alpha/beta hydrolase [Jannaschia marina]|uniref:alpha/beta hydrolase n=1 Tax=Jannaschia marina TaxID=2741674 RepID=UPI0015CD036D|nr:alpha/beta hydrolase [Jannaschia marina]